MRHTTRGPARPDLVVADLADPDRAMVDGHVPALHVRDVTHRFGATAALDGIDLDVGPGRFVAVVGPSGCGKSTLLRLLAGLDQPTSGAIRLGGDSPDEARRAGLVGWMAQRPALLPWSTVHDNIALAARIRSRPAGTPAVTDLLELVGLTGFGDARPRELSGGMQQRAALARTLALQAPVWLMDEPFAALDELTRERLATDLMAIWTRLRPTVVWVTHHLVEAVTLADRVVVLGPRPGRVVAELPVDLARPRDATSEAVQGLVRRARQQLAETATPVGAP